MPGLTITTSSHKAPKDSPLHNYHSGVMQAMCTQMAGQRRKSISNSDKPLPLAKKPSKTASHRQPALKQHVEEEMARRVKADRVLQDLSSDKSRSQARARETARRNKWAKSIASAVPPSDMPVAKKHVPKYEGTRRRNPQVV